MKILFYDASTPLPYTTQTFLHQALRGTESTILRISKALSHFHEIYIAQHCRASNENIQLDGIQFISIETAHQLSPDVVILLRHQHLLESTAKHFPHSRVYIWLHNMPARDLYQKRDILLHYHYGIIAVSHFHRHMIEKRLQGKWYQRIFSSKKKIKIPVHVLYNPIDDDLHPDHTPYDTNQMLFTSSPYKGLPQTLKLFATVRKHFPDYKLIILSSDVEDSLLPLPENVTLLGSLPYHQLIAQIRQSFCVFYPQTSRVETFGLVYAEANAVGTPVLAHDFGAAREVLSDESQLIDGNDVNTIIDKIKAWRNKRPKIKGKDLFRLSKITMEWRKLLESN